MALGGHWMALDGTGWVEYLVESGTHPALAFQGCVASHSIAPLLSFVSTGCLSSPSHSFFHIHISGHPHLRVAIFLLHFITISLFVFFFLPLLFF